MSQEFGSGLLSRKNRTSRTLGISIAAVLIGIAVGNWIYAVAEVRKSAPPEAFKAGDERNEAILREMLTVLKRMDGRLERLEAAAAQWTPEPATPGDPSTSRSRR